MQKKKIKMKIKKIKKVLKGQFHEKV
jgi:hypothetical protein